jgi:hypothetical protein
MVMLIDALRTGINGIVTPSNVSDSLRRHGAEADAATLSSVADRLATFINSVPDALDILIRLGKEPGSGRAIAFGTSQVLLYALDEEDLLPETSEDPVGILDDAYLVHRYLTRVYDSYADVRERLGAGQLVDPAAIEFVAQLLPDGVAATLDRTCDSLLTVGFALFSAGHTQPAAAHERLPLKLRLEFS